jgi:hypothetical protein
VVVLIAPQAVHHSRFALQRSRFRGIIPGQSTAVKACEMKNGVYFISLLDKGIFERSKITIMK